MNNTSSLYHFNTKQQYSSKIAQSDLSDHRLPSTASTSGFNSNDSSSFASNYQNGNQSPSRFFSFSNEASPSKSGHYDRDYQASPFGFDEFYDAPIISYLQEQKDEGSIPNHINTETILDPLRGDFGLILNPVQDAQDFEEEIGVVRVEQPIQNTQNQPKKKIFTIIRPEKETKMETEMEIEIKTEKPNSSYQLKNAPVHLFTAIQKGVSYYCDAKKDHFPSVAQELRKLSKPQLKKFEKLMYGYHAKGKTFKSLGKYLDENRKIPEILELLKTILIAFLRDREDVDKWLEGSRMEDHTKENIRRNLQKLEKDFLKILNGETL